MADVAYRVSVSGQVQGVTYRQSCRREAARLGVRGWVRNLSDGRVEIHAQGRADDVHQLLAWAGDGPRHADVTQLETTEVQVEDLNGFEIR